MTQQTINVADLDLSQLTDVKRQLDEELSHLSSSFGQLSKAQGRFKACMENVNEINPNNKDMPILVPLTNSLYVPGKLSDPENVVIDIGTGYFVSKSRKEAQKHYASKVEYVKANLEKLQETIEKKQENMNQLLAIMQIKARGEPLLSAT